jgi:hypothetical protein
LYLFTFENVLKNSDYTLGFTIQRRRGQHTAREGQFLQQWHSLFDLNVARKTQIKAKYGPRTKIVVHSWSNALIEIITQVVTFESSFAIIFFWEWKEKPVLVIEDFFPHTFFWNVFIRVIHKWRHAVLDIFLNLAPQSVHFLFLSP